MNNIIVTQQQIDELIQTITDDLPTMCAEIGQGSKTAERIAQLLNTIYALGKIANAAQSATDALANLEAIANQFNDAHPGIFE